MSVVLLLLVACQPYGQAVGRNLVRLSIVDDATDKLFKQRVSAKLCVPECGASSFEQKRSTASGRVTFRNVPITGTSSQVEFQIRDAKGTVLQSAPRFVYLSGTQRMQAKSVRVQKGAAATPTRVCIDKDGANTMIKGATEGILQAVSSAFKVYEDHCATDSTGKMKAMTGPVVVEYMCQNPNSPYMVSKVNKCRYGCNDGKCNARPPSPKVTCTDPDGRDEFTASTTTGVRAWWPVSQANVFNEKDFCTRTPQGTLWKSAKGTHVVEYVCRDHPQNPTGSPVFAAFDVIKCQNGCVNGACAKPKTTCSDTDNGRDYYVQGSVTERMITASGVTSSIRQDSCIGTTLQEHYCESGKAKSVVQPCRYGCSNGACNRMPTTVSPTPPTVTPVPPATPAKPDMICNRCGHSFYTWCYAVKCTTASQAAAKCNAAGMQCSPANCQPTAGVTYTSPAIAARTYTVTC